MPASVLRMCCGLFIVLPSVSGNLMSINILVQFRRHFVLVSQVTGKSRSLQFTVYSLQFAVYS